MRIRWKDFELPTRVSLERESARPDYGKFIVEPFERGFGTTIGNGLRRVLLSSIEGTAVTAARIEGVSHEFSTLSGVLEDVTDILLAVKRLRLRMQGEGPVSLAIDKKGKGIVTAGDVQCPAGTEVVNRDLVLATLTDDVAFRATLTARRGRGYVTSEENAPEEQEIGLIPVDSIFSPVYRVKYAVEATRVAKRTDYDRLILEVWTDGTVSPEMALVEAAKIYRKHLNPFVQTAEAREQTLLAEGLESLVARGAAAQVERLAAFLDGSIDALEFSARAKKALEEAKLGTVRDLASKTEEELAAAGLGPTVIREVEAKLKEKGLSLGAAAAR